MSTCRKKSTKNWADPDDIEHINVGSLQRIADAVEKMAGSYDGLLRAKQWAEEARDKCRKRLETEKRRNAALRGVIRKMKETKK